MEASAPVALVIQTRIADEGTAAYVGWQGRVGQLLQGRKGFLGQEVIAPSPPAQPDWIVVQRFQSLEDARSWMQSDDLHRLIAEVAGYFVGHDDIFLRTDVQEKNLPVSAIISCRVAPEDAEGFQRWEDKVFRAEVRAPGFVGHKLTKPIPGIQENWVIVVQFDTDENLTRWLDSPVRAALLEEGKQYQGDLRVRKSNYGFALWARDATAPPSDPLWILKSNLIVLLVLYPTVYVWGYLIGHPLIDAKGAPAWLSLFVGNLASTQLLGWFFVPWALKAFDPWLSTKSAPVTQLAGWVILLLLYALSMAGFAYVLSLPPLSFG
jgi:antibiotic biosynthesis monooxygenase (ABM) superfamily enzyme